MKKKTQIIIYKTEGFSLNSYEKGSPERLSRKGPQKGSPERVLKKGSSKSLA